MFPYLYWSKVKLNLYSGWFDSLLQLSIKSSNSLNLPLSNKFLYWINLNLYFFSSSLCLLKLTILFVIFIFPFFNKSSTGVSGSPGVGVGVSPGVGVISFFSSPLFIWSNNSLTSDSFSSLKLDSFSLDSFINKASSSKSSSISSSFPASVSVTIVTNFIPTFELPLLVFSA